MSLKKVTGFFGVVFMASWIYAGQDIRFNDGWKFYLGDATGAQATTFSDASWSTVYLPHTPRIELNYNTSSIYMGVCWYRKSFTPDASYMGKKCFLEFEAAMQTAQVYVNGALAVTHLGGYTPFVIDITNSLASGAATVIAVRLDNNPVSTFPPGNSNPDFLYFGGLYRNVYLHVTDSLHVTNAIYANTPGGGGVFVTYPSVSTSSASVQVKTNVLNESKSAKSCVLTTSIVTTAGQQVATQSTTASLAAGASNAFTQSLSVSGPLLWHPDHPNLYIVKSQVFDNTRLADTMSTTIGIRTIGYSKAGGFTINGSRLIFRGANRHQAYPYIGNAVPNSGQYRDAQRLKEYGFNFVRMSHYTQAKSFVDACDKLGILGLACLPGWQYFSSSTDFVNNSIIALRDMVRYYRNHPSVVLWESMHNESTPTAAFLTSAQTAAHEELPGNQMFTAGEESNGILDVYISSSQHSVRSYTGSRPCAISEYGDWDVGPCQYVTPITGCADRVDRSQGEAAMLTQAGNFADGLGMNRGLSWLSGDALWSGFDYQSWNMDPMTSSGAIDLFRIPKIGAYFFQSQRSPTVVISGVNSGPMVHIASQWTSTSARPIQVYSNCDQVSLYLNNTLVATQSPNTGTNLEHPPFTFAISSFASGTLRANGLIGGVVKASDTVSTPGSALKIILTVDTAGLPFAADGSDVAIVYASVEDAAGTVVPTASNTVTFSVSSGPGDLVGNTSVAAQAGVATILLRSRTTGGAITVSATASGLTTGAASVTLSIAPTTGIIDMLGSRSNPAGSGILVWQVGPTLHVKLPQTQSKAFFSLYDAQGKLMFRRTLLKAENTVPIGALPGGVFFGKLNNGPIMFVKE